MGNVHLVTGYAGKEHVTSADHGAFNTALLGSGQVVFPKGNQFAASIVTNNQVRVLDGDIYMQGRHIRLNEGNHVDLTIENGTQGYYRNDLIVARYTKNASTSVEDVNLVVIKGTAVASNPVDPEYTVGDLVDNHANQNDMPLYRVSLDGLTISGLTPLFSVFENTLGLTAEEARAKLSVYSKEEVEALRGYSKKETLTDTTKAVFELGASATPNEVFAFLGKYNQHWWKLQSNIAETVWNEVQTEQYFNNALFNDANRRTISYSDTVAFDNYGVAHLVGGVSKTVAPSDNFDFLHGKYMTISDNYLGALAEDTVYFIPDTVVFYTRTWTDDEDENTVTYTGLFTNDCLYLITSVMERQERDTTYVHSTERNAYPDSGSDANYIYEYLGIPFSNAAAAPKIVYGTYIGTGAYGAANKNTLALDSAPYLVFIFGRTVGILTSKTDVRFDSCNINGLERGNTAWDGETKTLSWYDTSGASAQHNEVGAVYTYVAILR